MRSVALVYPRANLDTVPSLVGAVDLLAANGYDVDVFTTFAAGQPAPAFASPRVRLRSLGVEGALDGSTASLRNAARRVTWVPRVARAPLTRGYATLSAGLSRGSQMLAQARTGLAARPAGYRCVIGVDPDGLALAFKLARGAPVVYYSLELLLSDELSTPADERLKATERTQSRRSAFVIVQDEERARLLADDNQLPARQRRPGAELAAWTGAPQAVEVLARAVRAFGRAARRPALRQPGWLDGHRRDRRQRARRGPTAGCWSCTRATTPRPRRTSSGSGRARTAIA